MRIRDALILAACALACRVETRSQAGVPPGPRVFSSLDGVFGLKILPAKDYAAPSTGVLFSLRSDGSERVVWKRKLLLAPRISQQVLIHHRYPIAIILSDPAGPGSKHCLVVYGVRGQVVRDLSLEQLLTPQEIALYIKASPGGTESGPSRSWRQNISGFRLDSIRQSGRDVPTLGIGFRWGKGITINLRSGGLTSVQGGQASEPEAPDVTIMPGTGA